MCLQAYLQHFITKGLSYQPRTLPFLCPQTSKFDKPRTAVLVDSRLLVIVSCLTVQIAVTALALVSISMFFTRRTVLFTI